jgi:hypothetical protein
MNIRHSLRITLATATAAALTGGLLTLAAIPATAATAKYADDFNGDGYRDLVTSAPRATVGGVKSAGAVVVNYGSASGISASNRKVITQNSNGIPGVAEYQDFFGDALASGDLNRDHYADLSVGGKGGNGADGALWSLRGSSSGVQPRTPSASKPPPQSFPPPTIPSSAT